VHSYEVFRHYERNHWRLADIPFDTIDPEKVRPEYVTLAKSAVMGESNSIAAQHGFYNEFDDYDFSAFVAIWGYEEIQHHFAFRTWLEATGNPMAAAPVEAQRAPYAPGTTPCATLATNIISELTVNHIYKAVASWVDEPVLAGIMTRASLDDAAHPEELPSVLETLYVYTSEERIKHPVGVFKGELAAVKDHETIDTGFEMFIGKVAATGELDRLQDKIRRTFGALTGLEISTNARIRRRLAEALA
jgi:hypothetical protein